MSWRGCGVSRLCGRVRLQLLANATYLSDHLAFRTSKSSGVETVRVILDPSRNQNRTKPLQIVS